MDDTKQEARAGIDLKRGEEKTRSSLLTIRTLSYTIQLVTLTIMIVVVMAALLGIFWRGFSRLEEHSTIEATKRVRRAMYDDFTSALGLLASFGNWNDFNNVMKAAYKSEGYDDFLRWVGINYPYAMMRDAVGMNFAIMYFNNGSLAAGVGYDLPTGNTIEVPSEMRSLSQDHPLLKDMNDTRARANGFVLTEALGPLLVSAYPIHYSPIKETPSGILVFARIKTEVITRSIATRAQMCVGIYGMNDKSVRSILPKTKSVQPTLINGYDQYWENNKVFSIEPVRKIDSNFRDGRVCYHSADESTGSERMATYQLYADLFGQKAIILRADVPRYIHRLGMNSFLLAFWLVFFILLVLAAFIILFTEINILRVIGTVTRGVTLIVETSDISKRIKSSGSDEISLLGSRVNRLLSMIETAQEQLKQKHFEMQNLLQKISSEESRSRTTMNSISDFIVTIDRETGIIINANNPFYDQLGYSAQEIEQSQLLASQLFKEYSFDADLMSFCELLSREDKSADVTISSKSGTILPCRVSASKAKMYQGDKVIEAYVVAIHDLSTELKMKEELQSEEVKLKQMEQQLEFDEMMRNPQLSSHFLQWLEDQKEHDALHKLQFLSEIQSYHSLTQTHIRFNKQQEITKQFLAEDSPKRLQITHKNLNRIIHEIDSGAGQYDLFDPVESLVKSSLITDHFSRYHV